MKTNKQNICKPLMIVNMLALSPNLLSAGLTYWGLNKMATILEMTFSNAFSWKKIFVFWFKTCSHGSNFPLVQWVNNVWGNGLVSNRQQTFTWTNDDPVNIHVSSCLNEARLYRRASMRPDCIALPQWGQIVSPCLNEVRLYRRASMRPDCIAVPQWGQIVSPCLNEARLYRRASMRPDCIAVPQWGQIVSPCLNKVKSFLIQSFILLG